MTIVNSSKYIPILSIVRKREGCGKVLNMKTYTYRIIIEPDENNTFHGYVPALPGCHTWGKTLTSTRENIRDAIDVYLRSLQADGEIIPEDKGVEIVETIKIYSGKKSPVHV